MRTYEGCTQQCNIREHTAGTKRVTFQMTERSCYEDAETAYQRSVELIAAGRIPEGIVNAKLAAERCPLNPTYELWLAWCFEQDNNRVAAAAHYKQACQLKDISVGTRLELAEHLLNLDEPDLALNQILTASREDSRTFQHMEFWIDYHRSRGLLQYDQSSIEAIRNAVPTTGYAHRLVTDLLVENHEYDAAVYHARLALWLEPSRDALRRLGFVLAGAGRILESSGIRAIVHWMDPDDWTSLSDMADAFVTYGCPGSLDAAANAYSATIRLAIEGGGYPDTIRKYYMRYADLLGNLKKSEEQLEALKEAVNTFPNDYEIRERLAVTYEIHGFAHLATEQWQWLAGCDDAEVVDRARSCLSRLLDANRSPRPHPGDDG